MSQGALTKAARAWGASLGFVANFRDRWGLVTSTRELVAELCRQYLRSTEHSASLVMAAQELLENLAKYAAVDGTFEFRLALDGGVPRATLRTENAATEEHLARAVAHLERITAAAEPLLLYDQWVASSGDREGSHLGLIRLRAEAGLSLQFSSRAGRLCIEASGSVEPREALS
jgi:hypothetical protein